jgi:hypothetical protein
MNTEKTPCSTAAITGEQVLNELTSLSRRACELEAQVAELGRRALMVLRHSEPEMVRDLEDMFGTLAPMWLLERPASLAGRSALELLASNEREPVLYAINCLKHGIPA